MLFNTIIAVSHIDELKSACKSICSRIDSILFIGKPKKTTNEWKSNTTNGAENLLRFAGIICWSDWIYGIINAILPSDTLFRLKWKWITHRLNPCFRWMASEWIVFRLMEWIYNTDLTTMKHVHNLSASAHFESLFKTQTIL